MGNVNAKNTPLIIAARDGDRNTVQALIDTKTDVNVQDEWGVTALIYAAAKGHAEIVQALVGAGAGVNLSSKNNETTALMAAVSQGYGEIARALIDAGANVNAQNNDGLTILMSAAYRGHTETVQVLIGSGANINAQDIGGATALVHAASKGHGEIVQALIDAGADVNTQELTALMVAAIRCHKEIAQALIVAGADVNLESKGGATPLMAAVSHGHDEIVQIFLNAGASSRPLGFDDRAYYSLSIAQASLLQFGYYIGCKLGLLTHPEQELCSAIKGGDFEKVQSLINTGSINVNHLPQENMSALELTINKAKEAAKASAQGLACLSPNIYKGIIRAIICRSAPWVVIKAIKDCVEAPNRHTYLPVLLERESVVQSFVRNKHQENPVTWATKHNCLAAIEAFSKVGVATVDEAKANDSRKVSSNSNSLIYSQNRARMPHKKKSKRKKKQKALAGK